mgnify:CR=1 FL=1
MTLPKLLADFERMELMRIDSFKLALKKLLSAEEAMLLTAFEHEVSAARVCP